MAMNAVLRAMICAAAFFFASSSSLLADGPPKNPQDIYGPRVQPATKDVFRYTAHRRSSASVDALRYWNQLAVDATGLDHTPVAAGEERVYGEQLGPTRSSRAMAIVHVAMFEAVNSILGGYRSYLGLPHTSDPASIDAAIATSAHDTLSALFPSQKPSFDVLYAQDLNRIPAKDGAMRDRGIAVGHLAAAGILALRANDGSAVPDPKLGTEWVTSNQPGRWRQDPIALSPIALGAHWGEVQPFVIRSATQFLAPPPPALASPEYTAAYDEVKSLGGDGIHTPTQRTAEQTYIGIYWAYDGTPSLCAPPRLYNEITTEISKSNSSVSAMARLFALVNVAMADSAISLWKSKYLYDFWRPVTGIRESDQGTGPTGEGDGNSQTKGDPTFWPLGAPASNLSGVNFTPPFPSYPSGHAGFGGALFETLRRFYGTDRIAFSFTSDEFDGETRGSDGTIRPLEPRSFASLSQAEEENGQSRIYLGIHWQFDKTEGIRMGQRVADYVFDNAFQPTQDH
jgi:hypothetical protein